MSIVQIRVGDQAPEWMLIEMQGTLECSEPGLHIDGFELGNLTQKGSQYELNIGIEKLIGEELKLKKPLLVFNKKTQNSEPNCKVAMCAIIRKKIVFSKRPTPIIVMQKSRKLMM